jgi:Asp-tRNA(Asn)/Glu-tRNA(Gln) amidotransferase C subunit
MGHLYNIVKLHEKELEIKKKIQSIGSNVEENEEIINLCKKIKCNNIEQFLYHASEIEHWLREGKSIEEIKDLYKI